MRLPHVCRWKLQPGRFNFSRGSERDVSISAPCCERALFVCSVRSFCAVRCHGPAADARARISSVTADGNYSGRDTGATFLSSAQRAERLHRGRTHAASLTAWVLVLCLLCASVQGHRGRLRPRLLSDHKQEPYNSLFTQNPECTADLIPGAVLEVCEVINFLSIFTEEGKDICRLLRSKRCTLFIYIANNEFGGP